MSKRSRLISCITLPTLSALPVSTALADEDGPPPPEQGWSFGPVLGLTSATVSSLYGGYGGYYEFKRRTGMAIGASARHFRKFNRRGTAEKFFVPEVGYRAFGLRAGGGDTSLAIKENQVAAAFLFQTRWGNDKGWQVLPHFTWGPQLGYVLGFNAELCYDGDCVSYDFVEYLSDYFGGIVRLGLGMNLGTGVNFDLGGQTVDLSLRWYQGLAPRIGNGLGLNTQVGLFGGIYF